jgi:hypothetical protein
MLEVFYHIKHANTEQRSIVIKTHNGYKMRRKDRKWSALAPGKWMGFSRLLPSILLSVGVCGNANIASKGVPGTLKPFLRTLKSVFSTFWKRRCDRFFMWRFENRNLK